MTKYVNTFLLIFGAGLLCFSLTLPQYTDEAAYNSEYQKIDWVELGREESFREFYSLKETYSTNKHRIQDYGLTFILLGWILYGITKNNWRNIRGPSSKGKHVALGYAVAALTVMGCIGDLFLEFWRGSFPHWADSLGIPLSGFPVLAIMVTLIITPFMLGLVGKFRAGEKLPRYGFKNFQWLYLSAAIVSLFLLFICIIDGFFWLVPPVLLWVYFCFSILSGRNAASKSV